LRSLSIHTVIHHDGSLLAQGSPLLFYLLQHVYYVRRSPIIITVLRPAVTFSEFGGRKFVTIHRGNGRVIRLRIKGRPTEVTGGHETRIDDCAELKSEQKQRNNGTHRRDKQPIISLRALRPEDPDWYAGRPKYRVVGRVRLDDKLHLGTIQIRPLEIRGKERGHLK
jgi:hypothetical protein